jgi:hypothetical protein
MDSSLLVAIAYRILGVVHAELPDGDMMHTVIPRLKSTYSARIASLHKTHSLYLLSKILLCYGHIMLLVTTNSEKTLCFSSCFLPLLLVLVLSFQE